MLPRLSRRRSFGWMGLAGLTGIAGMTRLAPLAALGPLRAHAQGAGTRVALVIGNAAYAGSPLPNAGNDARAMSTALEGMGFRVVQVRDAGKAQIERALADARDLLQGRSGTGLFYYAGHGLQLDWRNYLVPVDAQLASAPDVRRSAVDIQAVIDAFKAAGNRTNIVVLDACRDNPFGASASGKGLAPLDAPTGTFLAYATAPGHVAEDGTAQDGNGLYTRFLLKELQSTDTPIEGVFRRVRLQVRQASQGRQIPWESTSLEEEFVFATGRRLEPESARQRDEAFEAEKAHWDRIKASTRPQDFVDFLLQFPNGRIAELAQFRLDQLARPAVAPRAVPGGIVRLASGMPRYRLGDAWEMETTDHLSGRKQRIRREVTAIDGERVIIDHGEVVQTQMGATLVNRFGVKDPGVMTEPADLQLGKRWRSAFTNQRSNGPVARSFYEHRAVALEEVEVPAGRFTAFRVESHGESQLPNGGGRKLETTHWIDPATMLRVRGEVRQQDRRNGNVLEHETSVLVSRKLVARG